MASFFTGAYVSLILLKAFGAFTILDRLSWWLVLAPVWVPTAFAVIVLVIAVVLTIVSLFKPAPTAPSIDDLFRVKK